MIAYARAVGETIAFLWPGPSVFYRSTGTGQHVIASQPQYDSQLAFFGVLTKTFNTTDHKVCFLSSYFQPALRHSTTLRMDTLLQGKDLQGREWDMNGAVGHRMKDTE